MLCREARESEASCCYLCKSVRYRKETTLLSASEAQAAVSEVDPLSQTTPTQCRAVLPDRPNAFTSEAGAICTSGLTVLSKPLQGRDHPTIKSVGGGTTGALRKRSCKGFPHLQSKTYRGCCHLTERARFTGHDQQHQPGASFSNSGSFGSKSGTVTVLPQPDSCC